MKRRCLPTGPPHSKQVSCFYLLHLLFLLLLFLPVLLLLTLKLTRDSDKLRVWTNKKTRRTKRIKKQSVQPKAHRHKHYSCDRELQVLPPTLPVPLPLSLLCCSTDLPLPLPLPVSSSRPCFLHLPLPRPCSTGWTRSSRRPAASRPGSLSRPRWR